MSGENVGSKRESILIQRIREGEEHAFEIAFLKYHTPLCRYVWKYVQSEELSKEIIQEVFVKVWENRKDLKPSGHLRGFLFEVARNKALDYIKHQKIVRRYLSEAKQREREKAYCDLKRKERDYSDLQEAIRESVNNLPRMGRLVFELNRNEGLTYKEIAEHLDISVRTVETHMRRSLKKLKNSLSKYVSVLVLVATLGVLSCLIG